MLKIVVCVSGGGTNLQAIIDGIADGTITNTEIVGVISNNKNAYALERAKKAGIFAECISPKDYETREMFNDALLTSSYVISDMSNIILFAYFFLNIDYSSPITSIVNAVIYCLSEYVPTDLSYCDFVFDFENLPIGLLYASFIFLTFLLYRKVVYVIDNFDNLL